MFHSMSIQQHQWNNIMPPSPSVQIGNELHLDQIVQPVHRSTPDYHWMYNNCKALQQVNRKEYKTQTTKPVTIINLDTTAGGKRNIQK